MRPGIIRGTVLPFLDLRFYSFAFPSSSHGRSSIKTESISFVKKPAVLCFVY
jgi:hypothetical protein